MLANKSNQIGELQVLSEKIRRRASLHACTHVCMCTPTPTHRVNALTTNHTAMVCKLHFHVLI